MDLGGEDIILGYPWLATFKPKVTWKTATIDTTVLPVVIRTVNPHIEHLAHILARTLTKQDKWEIIQTLAEQSTTRTTATDLAIAAKQYTTKAKIPAEYQTHAKVFNEEEAQRFPPSHPWDHAVELKPTMP